MMDRVMESRRESACDVLETLDPAHLPVVTHMMREFAKATGYHDWP